MACRITLTIIFDNDANGSCPLVGKCFCIKVEAKHMFDDCPPVASIFTPVTKMLYYFWKQLDILYTLQFDICTGDL